MIRDWFLSLWDELCFQWYMLSTEQYWWEK